MNGVPGSDVYPMEKRFVLHPYARPCSVQTLVNVLKCIRGFGIRCGDREKWTMYKDECVVEPCKMD